MFDSNHRLHLKLCVSLAQADKMQGKSGSSLSAIDEAEKAFFETMKGKVSVAGMSAPAAIISGDLRSGVLSRVEVCLRVFESVFLIS